MRLYIVRHAWAEEPDDRWSSDAARPLTDDGKKRYRKVVEALVERGFAPEVIAVRKDLAMHDPTAHRSEIRRSESSVLETSAVRSRAGSPEPRP